MSDLFVLDTHTLLWYLDNHPRLGNQARQILQDHSNRFWLPAIALAEALFILEKGRTPFTITEEELLASVDADSRIDIISLDHQAVIRTLDCKAIDEMHDRQIVATALLAQDAGFDVAILTRDENITSSGLVQAVW